MAHDDETRTRSLAMNQARFRYSNERLRRTAAHIRFEPSDRVPFVCECADRDCFEVVMLCLEEDDRLRTHPSWLLFVAGHEDDPYFPEGAAGTARDVPLAHRGKTVPRCHEDTRNTR